MGNSNIGETIINLTKFKKLDLTKSKKFKSKKSDLINPKKSNLAKVNFVKFNFSEQVFLFLKSKKAS